MGPPGGPQAPWPGAPPWASNTKEPQTVEVVRESAEPNKNPSQIFDEERKLLEVKYKNVALIARRIKERC